MRYFVEPTLRHIPEGTVLQCRRATQMPSVRIDEDVYRELQKRAEPFVDTPNSVLRRVLGLSGDAPDLKAAERQVRDPEPRAGGPAPRRSARATSRQRPARRSRRLAKATAASGRGGSQRLAGGILLPLDVYKPLIVEKLRQEGGVATARDVIHAVGEMVRDRLSPEDLEATKSGEVRWVNRMQFARHRLVEEGVLAKGSPRGQWALAE